MNEIHEVDDSNILWLTFLFTEQFGVTVTLWTWEARVTL